MNAQKLKVINRDMIKYIAVFLMFWGHLVAWLTSPQYPDTVTPYEVMPLWQNILSHLSLFCPPVMFFMIADGYKYTRDRKKYALRLLIFACVTQVFYWIMWVPQDGWWESNVMFTLLAGLLGIIAWESKLKRWQRITLVVLLSAATLLIMSDWVIFGVIFIVFLHVFRDKPKQRFIAYTVTALLWIGVATATNTVYDLPTLIYNELMDFAVVMAAYLCMTVFYNGKKGKHPKFAKWFFYIFYPAHYLIIYAVYLMFYK